MSWLSDAINAQTNNIGAAMTSTPHRQKVIDLRAKYNNALADVRGDSSLSELGKTQMIARAWTTAWLVLPLPILFPAPFLQEVLWPMIEWDPL